METMFFRDGTAAGTHAPNPKGKAEIARRVACGRCGGAGGSDRWAHTGWTCYECGGACHFMKPAAIYTAAALAKLDATAEKKRATAQAKFDAQKAKEAAERAVRHAAFQVEHGGLLERAQAAIGGALMDDLCGDTYCDVDRSMLPAHVTRNDVQTVSSIVTKAWDRCEISPAQIDLLNKIIARIAEKTAAAQASAWFASVGDKVEVEVTLERRHSFERKSFSGYGTETCIIVTMRTDAGHVLVSKSGYTKFTAAALDLELGARLVVKGTVKALDEYNGTKQTVLQRVSCKVAQPA